MGERGIGLVELLVALFGAGVILVGLVTLYLGATRAIGESAARTALQRQGTLVVEEIGRRARAATAVSAGCNGQPGALSLETPGGALCYYAGPAGQLCEDRGGGCRDLLGGALQVAMPYVTPIALLAQTVPAEPACPEGVPAGSRCFEVLVAERRARVAFAISDGLHAMAFEVAHSCAGRNC